MWTLITDDPPKSFHLVPVCGPEYKGYAFYVGYHCFEDAERNDIIAEITHWFKLPPTPYEGT